MLIKTHLHSMFTFRKYSKGRIFVISVNQLASRFPARAQSSAAPSSSAANFINKFNKRGSSPNYTVAQVSRLKVNKVKRVRCGRRCKDPPIIYPLRSPERSQSTAKRNKMIPEPSLVFSRWNIDCLAGVCRVARTESRIISSS